MAFTLTWSLMARSDFWVFLDYIAKSNRPRAADFGVALLKTVRRLKEFPESGRIVPEFDDPAIREIIHRPCRIVYRVKKEEKQIEIARIWHAARGTPEM